MDWGFVLGLILIALLFIGLIVYLGKKLSKFVQKNAPESDLAINITPTGNALFAIMAGFWGVCIIAYELAPNSKLGVFVGTADGLTVVVLGSLFLPGIVALILNKLGFPTFKRGGNDA